MMNKLKRGHPASFPGYIDFDIIKSHKMFAMFYIRELMYLLSFLSIFFMIYVKVFKVLKIYTYVQNMSVHLCRNSIFGFLLFTLINAHERVHISLL